jgi:hypothetical protein
MPNKNFIKAKMERVMFTKTEIIAKGFHFDVKSSTKGIEVFKDLFKKERAKMTYNESCFVNGVYDVSKDLAYTNLLKVIESGDYKLTEFNYDYFERTPAKLKCCGEWLSLGSFTNTCPSCNADYNGSGSMLASRSQWGEETGESWYDCY